MKANQCHAAANLARQSNRDLKWSNVIDLKVRGCGGCPHDARCERCHEVVCLKAPLRNRLYSGGPSSKHVFKCFQVLTSSAQTCHLLDSGTCYRCPPPPLAQRPTDPAPQAPGLFQMAIWECVRCGERLERGVRSHGTCHRAPIYVPNRAAVVEEAKRGTKACFPGWRFSAPQVGRVNGGRRY